LLRLGNQNAMTPDIKRKTELYIVTKLLIALPSLQIVPFTGGSASMGAVELEPPFTIVAVRDAQKAMSTEGTWYCTGNVQVITHSSETPSEQHSELARQIYAALDNIPTQADPDFSLHGLDIQGMAYAFDDTESAHADIISFTAGVGG
jgi:hypothetical protein